MTTTEAVVQSGAYERPLDYLPERDIYEALCRGEGVKMVRDKNFLTMLPLHKGSQAWWNMLFFSSVKLFF